MYSIIATIIIFILIIMSYEKNILKYGILMGLVNSILQTLSLGEETYVALIPIIVMFIGYSAIATIIGMMMLNMDSRLKYVIAYDLCFSIASSLFFRFVVISVVYMFN